MGTVTFSGESATGWQEAPFATPIAIAADTTYVASYHTTSGNYATGTSFAAAGVDNPPLHALQDGVDGAERRVPVRRRRGLSHGHVRLFELPGRRGASSRTMRRTRQRPTIVARVPSPGATGVATGTNITAQFNEPMAEATITASTVELRGPGRALVPPRSPMTPAPGRPR